MRIHIERRRPYGRVPFTICTYIHTTYVQYLYHAIMVQVQYCNIVVVPPTVNQERVKKSIIRWTYLVRTILSIRSPLAQIRRLAINIPVQNSKMPERRTASSVNSNNTSPQNGHARSARTSRTTNRQQSKDSGQRFHPNLITAQIVSFQCFQYLAQTILFQLNALLYENSTVSVDRLFTDKYVHLWKAQGWPDCAAIFFAALIG